MKRTIQQMYKNATSMKFVLHLIRSYYNDSDVTEVKITEPTKCSLTNELFPVGTTMYRGKNTNTFMCAESIIELDAFVDDNKEDKRIAWLIKDIESQPKDIKMAS
jgi:chromosome condensin MukBEF MukE localization factor